MVMGWIGLLLMLAEDFSQIVGTTDVFAEAGFTQDKLTLGNLRFQNLRFEMRRKNVRLLQSRPYFL